MARMLNLDIAIQGLALPGTVDTFPPLPIGFTQHRKPGNPLALARKLKTSDSLGLAIYGFTHAVPEFKVREMSLMLSFRPSRNEQTFATPFAACTYDRFHIHPAQEGDTRSYAFENDAVDVWNVFPNQTAPPYPQSQYQLDKSPWESGFQRFENPGAFQLSVLLRVLLDDGTEATYRTDPEMIVDTNGDDHPVEDAE